MPRLAVGHDWANCVFCIRLNLQMFNFLVAVAYVAATANLLQYTVRNIYLRRELGQLCLLTFSKLDISTLVVIVTDVWIDFKINKKNLLDIQNCEQ